MTHIMPEAEAKTKICPFISSGAHLRYCLGGQCVLWHWEDDEVHMTGHCGLGVHDPVRALVAKGER